MRAWLYFASVERQLKERLIGAAVLVAAAVVLVPEMFSGTANRVTSTDIEPTVAANSVSADGSTSADQIKTYHIQLQERDVATPQVASSTMSSASSAPLSTIDSAVVTAAPAVEAHDTNTSLTSSSSASTAHAQDNAVKTPVVAAASSSIAVQPREIKQATPVSAKPATAAIDNKRWVVQIGSFGTEAKAKQIVTDLKAQDFAAYFGPIAANGKTLYRVRVGTPVDRAAADGLLKRLKGNYPEASVVPGVR